MSALTEAQAATDVHFFEDSNRSIDNLTTWTGLAPAYLSIPELELF